MVSNGRDAADRSSGSDQGDGKRDQRVRKQRFTFEERVEVVRDIYATDPRVVVIGVFGLLSMGGLLVGYALLSSLLGTLIGLVGWAAFTSILLRRGTTFQMVLRSAVGGVLFLAFCPTVIRLVTTLPEAAKPRLARPIALSEAMAAVGMVLTLLLFSHWAISTSTPPSE